MSILPVHGAATGVTTSGVRWRLVDAELAAGTTRAMSNEATEATVHVALGSGPLVVLQPGIAAAPITPRPGPYDPTPRTGGTR